MTPRRLINKKAYLEMVILEKRCAMETRVKMKPYLMLVEDYKEMFKLEVKDLEGTIIKEIYGKDYKSLEILLTEFLDGFGK